MDFSNHSLPSLATSNEPSSYRQRGGKKVISFVKDASPNFDRSNDSLFNSSHDLQFLSRGMGNQPSHHDRGDTSTTYHSAAASRTPSQIVVGGGVKGLAAREQKAVLFSKRAMIAVLVLVAASLCTATFFVLKREEQEDFRRQFENYASEIVAVSKEHVESTFVTIEAFANTITSYAQETGAVWPNVTLPDYTSRAERVAKLAAGARLVTLAPLVSKSQRAGFEAYARSGVIFEQIQEDLDYLGIEANATNLVGIPDRISYLNLSAKAKFEEPEESSGPYLVNWQRMPFEVEPDRIFVMNNMLRIPTIRGAVVAANLTKGAKAAFFEGILGVESQVIQPIFRSIVPPHNTNGVKEMVGAVWIVLGWGNYFQNLLPENVHGIHVVLISSCGFKATYEINGLEAKFLGLNDSHQEGYDDYEVEAEFFSFGAAVNELSNGEQLSKDDVCVDQLTLRLYPTKQFEQDSTFAMPAISAAVVAAVFLFTSAFFITYDWAVTKRQRKIMTRLLTQDRIVSSLFPATIRDRLYGIGDRMNGGGGGDLSSSADDSATSSKKSLLDSGDGVDKPAFLGTKPIADLFLETTVLFADIAGFTPWSSAREPSQVFILLENIYGAFDKLTHRYGVFKVETIGDCYVAVAGLPDPRKDHAVAMAKFARDCIDKMSYLTSRLEVSLGPDTGDLDLRIGIHSGQVTAGVLRGERSRFQLFGDTVNTAARMESTGIREKIHISDVTAQYLRDQGRSKWVHEREERIAVHGKGKMQTFWLETKKDTEERHCSERRKLALKGLGPPSPGSQDGTEENSDAESSNLWEEDSFAAGPEMSKQERLIEWNVEIMSDLIRRILAARTTKSKSLVRIEKHIALAEATVLEEFKEIITLPKLTMSDLRRRKDKDYIMLDDIVVAQLRKLICSIAEMYNDHHFHNFEHASHVTASVAKLMSRIIKVDTTRQTSTPDDLRGADLAGHSYGITSDPLTQFAVVFSALVHDAGHPGVPNAQLVKEKVPMSAKYKEKSIAEQNSVDIVWAELLKEDYSDLRACIYADEVELRRFRQLLVNIVMATDICDKELGALRRARWNIAFSDTPADEDPNLLVDRKATIVLEHLIQASDVAHTMQHWQVYRKWNELFFRECYASYKSGRAETDPSTGWYKGEIGFFDYYVIPLAKKLDSCGVFGVSSHEYLNYAMANREEWMGKGEDLVGEYIATFEADHAVVAVAAAAGEGLVKQ